MGASQQNPNARPMPKHTQHLQTICGLPSRRDRVYTKSKRQILSGKKLRKLCVCFMLGCFRLVRGFGASRLHWGPISSALNPIHRLYSAGDSDEFERVERSQNLYRDFEETNFRAADYDPAEFDADFDRLERDESALQPTVITTTPSRIPQMSMDEIPEAPIDYGRSPIPFKRTSPPREGKPTPSRIPSLNMNDETPDNPADYISKNRFKGASQPTGARPTPSRIPRKSSTNEPGAPVGYSYGADRRNETPGGEDMNVSSKSPDTRNDAAVSNSEGVNGSDAPFVSGLLSPDFVRQAVSGSSTTIRSTPVSPISTAKSWPAATGSIDVQHEAMHGDNDDFSDKSQTAPESHDEDGLVAEEDSGIDSSELVDGDIDVYVSPQEEIRGDDDVVSGDTLSAPRATDDGEESVPAEEDSVVSAVPEVPDVLSEELPLETFGSDAPGETEPEPILIPVAEKGTRSERETNTSSEKDPGKATAENSDFVPKAAGSITELDEEYSKLASLEKKIFVQNKQTKLNVNSAKQVSLALFGIAGQSTNKDALDALAGGGNKLAALILDYRKTKSAIKRLERRMKLSESGRLVKSASTVARVANDTIIVERSDPLLLVDASAYIHRAYHSMPPIHRSDGTPTGAVMGFCNMLSRLILQRMMEGEQPRLVLVFDPKGKTFRHELYPDYKGHRPGLPVDLIPQFALVREAGKAFGIPLVEAPNFEADDVIATLATMATKEGIDTNILSGDKDLWQLVSDKSAGPCVHMIDPMSMERITYDGVVAKWSCEPQRLGDILALAGDSADNIPGVPGIGPKIAAALIEEYGDLENLLENLDSIKQNGRREKLQKNTKEARLSRQLVELKRDIPVEKMKFSTDTTLVSELKMEIMDPERILAFYDVMGFKDLHRRFNNRLVGASAKRLSKAPERNKVTVPSPDDYSDVPF